jgi:L-cysteate sulfo-lyase
MQLSRFPRLKLCHAPTPLEKMSNISEKLGGPTLWIKRDDCTGIATGGNKVRKLEFLMGEAVQRGATHIVTQGAVQSNHVRQTAAVAIKLGLKCTALLEHRVATNDPDYLEGGNVLMDRLMGIAIEHCPADTDMNAAMTDVAARLTAAGETPYVIPGGGSNPVGALGYAAVALELVNQANEIGLRIDRIVHATGSAGTQAGLLAGLAMINARIPVLGIGVRRPKSPQEQAVYDLANATADLLDGPTVPHESVIANCDYVGDGYGVPSDGMAEAVMLLARTETIFLDPVYSGKAMAGLIDLVRKKEFSADENIVFLHTGGQVALFGYSDFLNQAASSRAAERPVHDCTCADTL